MRKCDSDISQGESSAARSLRRGGVAYKNEIEMLFGVDRNDSADDVISNEEGDSLQPSDTNLLPPIHSVHTGKMSRVSALSDFDICTGSSNNFNYTSKPDPPEQRKLYKQSSTLTSVDEDDTERDTLSSGEHKVADEQYESRIKEKLTSDKRSEMKRSINSTSTYSSASTSNDKFEDRLRQKMEQGKPSSSMTSRPKHSINSSSSTTTSNDKFEDRLRAKMRGDRKHSTASTSLSNDNFDDRLNAKMVKQNDSSGEISTSQNGSDGFEGRLKAKLKDSNRISSGASTTTSSLSVSPKTAGEGFENRLKAKLKDGNATSSVRMSDNRDSVTLQSKNSSASYESSRANGEFENRLRAKLKDGNKKQSSLPVDRRTPSPSLSEDVETEQSEEEAIESYAYISECSEEGRFNDILKCMEDNPSLPSSIVSSQAIDKLNDSLVLSHNIINSNVDSAAEIDRLNEHWKEVLASSMSNHNTNEMVQLSALRTIWLIVSLDARYALEFVSNKDSLNALGIAMKNHQQSKPIQLCGTGIIAHLSSIKQGASLLLSFESGTVIERLGGALSIHSHFVLEALFNLLVISFESKSSQQFDSIIETIAQCKEFQHQGNNKSMNAIETVFGIMTHCPEHVTLQNWGCRLLGVILSSNDCLFNPSNEKQLPTIISSILYHLELIMTKYTPPLSLYESIICLLSAISCCSDNILAGREESISQMTVATMIAEPTSHTVALYGCHCLNNVLHRQDETPGVLLRAITNFDGNLLVEMALNTLACLTKGAFQYCVSLLNNEVGLIETIIECMIKYQDEPYIQSSACDLLSALALDREITLRICSSGGASRIITTLYTHRNEPSVVCKAFTALSNISGTVKASIMQESQAPRCILSTMEANETDVTIQTQAVNALWTLGSMNSTLKEEIIQQSGIQLISKAMKQFITCQQLQEKGIIALWTLASSLSVASSSELVICATESIIDAISAHIMCQQVCQHGLGALSSLTCPKSIDGDGDRLIDLIIGCMWMHAEVASIQQGALGALSKATVNKSTNVVIQITAQDIDAIINAMRMHITTKDCARECDNTSPKLGLLS